MTAQPDLFEAIQDARDRLSALLEAEEQKQRKLVEEQQRQNMEVLLANCLAMLKDIPTTNLSSDKRLRMRGLREQITTTLRGAA